MSNVFSRAAIKGGRIRAANAARSSFSATQNDMVKQVDEILKKLETIPKEFESKATKRALRKGANIIRDAAKQNTPFKEGKLKDSIKTFSLRNSKLALFVGPRFPRKDKGGGTSQHMYYGGFVEFGTRNMAGTGYMRMAYDTNKSIAIEQIKVDTGKIINNWIKNNKIRVASR